MRAMVALAVIVGRANPPEEPFTLRWNRSRDLSGNLFDRHRGYAHGDTGGGKRVSPLVDARL
jgi:hypothetical protein